MAHDIAIIGSGIIGLATGLAITEDRPGVRLAIVDKEPGVGAHQSGHNSGVLHSGIYYRPGSLKARLCLAGADAMAAFCDENGVPLARRGKVIVAVDHRDLTGLDELERRARANGVDAHRMGPAELADLEPHAAGMAALHVPSAGVVDFSRVTTAMARVLADRGADLILGTEAKAIAPTPTGVAVHTNRQPVVARYVVNCAGLHADRVATMTGIDPPVRIIPFRGEYYRLLRPELVSTAIYPVPDLDLPFLGVHVTRLVGGEAEAGPNAVPALAREGYRWQHVSARDTTATLKYPGSWRLGRRHWRFGVTEMLRSMSRKRFAASVRRLVPELNDTDLTRSGSGVRAQAVAPDGTLVDDFVIVAGDSSLHLLNAPSPGATASLAIGRHIASQIGAHPID